MSKESTFKRYSPKRWHPEFDLIVLKSISGRSNSEIAEEIGYSKQQVSNILSTVQAEEIKNRFRENLKENVELGLRETVEDINTKALRLIADFIQNKELNAEEPLAFIDRVIKITSVLNKDVMKTSEANKGTQVSVNNLQINHFSDLKESLKLSREVNEIHLDAIERSRAPKLLSEAMTPMEENKLVGSPIGVVEAPGLVPKLKVG